MQFCLSIIHQAAVRRFCLTMPVPVGSRWKTIWMTWAAVGAVLSARSVIAIPPPAPPGCPTKTTTFTHNTPVPISIGAPAVYTSQINVSGLDPYLWDIDLQTFITHSYCADLDIT